MVEKGMIDHEKAVESILSELIEKKRFDFPMLRTWLARLMSVRIIMMFRMNCFMEIRNSSRT